MRWAVPFALAVFMCSSGQLLAQRVSAPALKAAFLLNFVKFAQWPGDAVRPGASISLCVLGDEQVAASLEGTVKGHPVDGHDPIVKRVRPDDAVRDCHLLYVSRLGTNQWTTLVQSLNNAPALTISDLSGFAEAGGIANLIVEDQKIRFAINVDAADRARLRLSSSR
jgi:hypothetical protein